MDTKIYKHSTEEDFELLARLLQSDELVSIPTETVYGLGANGLSEKAVKKIFLAKGRPADNPLILHVADSSDVNRLVTHISPTSKKLMKAFWPGPLTILFPKSERIPSVVTGGLPTVAIRCPKTEVTRKLIHLAGVPIAAPSANLSGRPSPTTAESVYQDMEGRIAAILDAGPCEIGLESTVVEVGENCVTILRPGGITAEMLSKVVDRVSLDEALEDATVIPKAPGMKYRHYAPKGEVEVIVGEREAVAQAITTRCRGVRSAGILIHADTLQYVDREVCTHASLYTYRSLEELSYMLYEVLLTFDHQKIASIWIEGVESIGLGTAIMNRLEKASNHHVTRV